MDLQHEGGAKRKPAAKKPAAPKKAAAKEAPKKKMVKKGGSADLVGNLTGLAVPFAFLLAKQGLEAMKEKEKKSAPKKTPTPARKASMAGGSCNNCTGMTMSGGSLNQAKKLAELKNNIDMFLAKF